jgi:PAS domain S-box-containing protein
MPRSLESPALKQDLQEQIRDLEERLAEANETIRAFSSGEIDAIVGSGPDGDRVYTLKGADETYRVMVQEMAEGALTLTPEGLILFSNEQFARMLRRPLEQVIGARIQDFVAPHDIDTAVVASLLKGTATGKAEVRLSLDGAILVPVYLSIQNVVLDGVACFCLIVTDLSAQKRYEEKLAVMEAVPVAVFIARGVECLTMSGNRMACELLRLPAGGNVSPAAGERETPKAWRELRDGRDIPAEELPMQVAARTGQPVHDYEFDVEFDDGASRCWLGNAVPLFDELKRPRGAVGAFVDITDRKRAEEKLGIAHAELQNLANGLAHGLREPLASVLKFNGLLAQEHGGRLSEEASRYLSGSVASALKMETILGGLFRYWEVSERDTECQSTVDCNRAVLQAQRNLQQAIGESGAAVTVGALPTIVADEVMIVQLFQSLIGNSIRYRSKDSPTIHISAMRAGERWLFSVRDNGIGIDRSDYERVFGMFSSLNSPDGPSASGAGMGLALCRKVIERHGGRIWVESEAGRGAAVRFTLPIYLDSALPVAPLPLTAA